MMGIEVPETCLASNNICNKNHLFHLVGILFPHINDNARSKSHQITLVFKNVKILTGWVQRTSIQPLARLIPFMDLTLKKPTWYLEC